MSDVVYRGNLKVADFPFLSELQGRSIIVKQQDQNNVAVPTQGDKGGSDMGIPQIYYCHNVIPTNEGYRAVGYEFVTAAVNPPRNDLMSVVTIRDGAGNYARLANCLDGTLLIMVNAATGAWLSPGTPPAAATIAGKRMTVAFVSGTTYIYFAGVGCYVYDWGTGNMTLTALTGLVAADILGLCANKGYLIAYSVDAVAWSSTILATDFVPDLITGAGGGQVEGAKGKLVTIESVYGGMIAFTEHNAVAAIASDNTRYPYSFIEITGGGGLTDPNFVSYDSNSTTLYAYTTAGLQLVGLKQSQVVFPECTDFLSGALFEDFDDTTNTFSVLKVPGSVMEKRLVMIASRYLLISYGNGSLTHVLFYDTVYKQWGRLKINHIDCFEFDRAGTETPKKSIGFVQADGTVRVLDMDIFSTTANGTMILGKFQYVRTRLLQLQRVALENVNEASDFEFYDMPTTDGKNLNAPIVGYLAQNTGKFREYLFHNTAMNHSLLWKGKFNAVSVVLTFNVAGAR